MKNKLIFCMITIIVSLTSFAKADYWAAIAVDYKTGIQSMAWNYPNYEEAKKIALQSCNKKTRNKCTVAATFSNGCGAAAWSSKTKQPRTANHETSLKGAENAALARCRNLEKDPNCKIVASVCTSWDTYKWWYIP